MVPKGKFNPLLAVVITSLVLAFFLLGLISGRLRRWVWRFETEGGAVIRSSDTRTRTPKALHYGLDRQVVEALPLVQYRDLPADEQVEKYIDCSVCLVAFDATDTLRLLPICSHAFHSNCIDEWFLSHITCPLCRVCLAHSTDHAATEAVGQLPPHDDRIRSPEDSDVVEVVIGGDGELDSTTNTTILETSQADVLPPGTPIANTFATEEHGNGRSIPWNNTALSFKPPVQIDIPPAKVPLTSIRRTSSAGSGPELANEANDDGDDSPHNSSTQFHAIDIEYCISNGQNPVQTQADGSRFVRLPDHWTIEDPEGGASRSAGKAKATGAGGDLQRAWPTTRWSFPNLRQIAPI